ncbi:MAG TPA: hypothetical protein VJ742_06905 [Nitrososphaera sp.]|nr:hypothetical protein [Nitrososphaera sp.]
MSEDWSGVIAGFIIGAFIFAFFSISSCSNTDIDIKKGYIFHMGKRYIIKEVQVEKWMPE